MAGAELVLVPTAQPDTPDAPFIAEKIVPVRAFENGIAIVYADHAGARRALRLCRPLLHRHARRQATPPARPPHGSAVIVADYEPARYAHARAANPYLADRRTDLF